MPRPVFDVFEAEGGSGGIIVLLQEAAPGSGTGAVFSASYEGMTREEALKTAQRFSWSAMKEQAGKLT